MTYRYIIHHGEMYAWLVPPLDNDIRWHWEDENGVDCEVSAKTEGEALVAAFAAWPEGEMIREVF